MLTLMLKIVPKLRLRGLRDFTDPHMRKAKKLRESYFENFVILKTYHEWCVRILTKSSIHLKKQEEVCEKKKEWKSFERHLMFASLKMLVK